ncbi:hypothetical protein CS063_01925 [Sporanaerobium hydrogeniformans]|uniref:Uncharacterized protein n=1 Tax=Sporanaerobium hydrogeniformans TaxID=3072179 RepID=A0AC61DGZ6_9FIRM|nr:histidine kinase [Sporanaerobium hydrogeniformans]PHV72258.1 hypothetical protein CS063_01925 [Sporanaerobium hydrogeniformans]
MLKKLHFQGRLFFIIAMLFLFSIFMIFVGVSIYIYQNMMANSKALAIETTEAYTTKVEQLIKDMNVISTQIVGNATIQSVFMEAIASTDKKFNYFSRHLEERRKVQVECCSINIAQNGVSRINIYRKPNMFISYNVDILNNDYIYETLNTQNEEEIVKTNAYYNVLPPHLDKWSGANTSKLVFSLVRPLTATYYTKENIATIEVSNDYNKLEKIFEESNENNKEMQVLIIDEDYQTLVYPYNEVEQLKVKYYAQIMEDLDEEPIKLIGYEGKKEVICRRKLQSCNWSILTIQPYKIYVEPVRNMITLITLLGIVFTIIGILAIFITTRKLTLPIRDLREALSGITIENIQLEDNTYTNNEIELLKNRFEDVLEALQASANSLALAHSAEYRAKLSALQAQINPHFLYNSLMAISAAGQEANSDKVQSMCSQLSDLFRYASSDGAESTIGAEMITIKNYLDFMKWRYLEELQYHMEDYEVVSDVVIPKLILQPLIENCFTHAFYTVRPPFFISIQCYREESTWYIIIKDNGGGFKLSALEEIRIVKENIDAVLTNNQYGVKLETKDKALMNVYARLKMIYKERTIFEIQNSTEGGAIIKIGGLCEYEKS